MPPRYADTAKVQEAYRDLWTRLARVPGRHRRRRHLVAAAQQHDGVGTDHGRRARRLGQRAVHQRRSARRRRRLLPRDGDPAASRDGCSPRRTRATAPRVGGDRRAHGADAVAGRRRPRQALPHRRHRRQRPDVPWITVIGVVGVDQAGRARHRFADGGLFPADATDAARHHGRAAHDGRSRGARRRRSVARSTTWIRTCRSTTCGR